MRSTTTTFTAAFLVAMLISSWLSEMVPRVSILVAVGTIVMVVGLFGWLKARRGGFAFSGQKVA